MSWFQTLLSPLLTFNRLFKTHVVIVSRVNGCLKGVFISKKFQKEPGMCHVVGKVFLYVVRFNILFK